MPKTFRNVILASTGDHGSTKDDQIQGWVHHAGGTFAKELSKHVTHLVCSERAWKRYYPIVKEARRMRNVHIVKLNWLVDSLLIKSRKPLPTIGYEYEQKKVTKCGVKNLKRKRVEVDDASRTESGDEAFKAERAKKHKKQDLATTEGATPSKNDKIKQAGKELDLAGAEFEKFMGQKGYRPFTDQSGFTYILTLVKKNILKNRLEKFTIKVRYAPSFTAQSNTAIAQPCQGLQKRHPQVASSTSKVHQARVVKINTSPLGESVLTPCPVPMYYFPEPYAFARNPCIAACLPRRLTAANPNLRVRVPDPWAQSLQLFISDNPPTTPPSGNPKYTAPSDNDPLGLRSRCFAAYIVYTKPGTRHVQELVPAGSSFDFAWTVFTKTFAKKTGVEWTDIHNGWKKGIKIEDIVKEKVGGEDGVDEDERWDMLEPPGAVKRVSGGEKDLSEVEEARMDAPFVTMLINATEVPASDCLEAKARTPEEGW